MALLFYALSHAKVCHPEKLIKEPCLTVGLFSFLAFCLDHQLVRLLLAIRAKSWQQAGRVIPCLFLFMVIRFIVLTIKW